MQTIENPYTGDSLTIDPRTLAQRIMEVQLASRGLCKSHHVGRSER